MEMDTDFVELSPVVLEDSSESRMPGKIVFQGHGIDFDLAKRDEADSGPQRGEFKLHQTAALHDFEWKGPLIQKKYISLSMGRYAGKSTESLTLDLLRRGCNGDSARPRDQSSHLAEHSPESTYMMIGCCMM